MTTNDPLAATLSKIDNATKVSKQSITVFGTSKLIKSILKILQANEYILDVMYEENVRGGKAVIALSSIINHCGSIKPRFKVKKTELEKFEQRYLPAKGFGILIISTSKGLMTNVEAKEQNIGGRLIAYCY